jgi:4-amino-4-deoxy-L-arabinose transferase-like glycosyltransferase
MLRDNKKIVFIIAVIGAILYIPFLGSVHLFDWDEINFAESAREMIVSGNYLDVQINFEKFWEKPPLFIWLQVLSMKLFGINEFAARFPNAIIGIISLISLFLVGKNVKSTKFGLIWTVFYAGSLLPFLYFKSGIIDPLFNLFIFLGIYFFYRFSIVDTKKWVAISISATFIGLGILTKGPVALLIFGLTVFVYMIFKNKYKQFLHVRVIAMYVFVVSFVGGFWFILQYLNGNKQILIDFITYQIRLFSTKDAGHGGFLLYHFVVVFIGVFPASIFALKGFKREKDDQFFQDFHLWMLILFWVIMILFTIVSTKIVHYSSMAYFSVTFLASYFVYYWLDNKKVFSKWLKHLLVVIATIWALAVVLITLIGKNTKSIIDSQLIHDSFVKGNLSADVYWSGFEVVIGLLFLVLIIWAIYFTRQKIRVFISIVIASILFIYSTLIVIVPKIEAFSQRALVEFYQSQESKPIYLTTYGIKSYAQFFYSKMLQPDDNKYKNRDWILTGNTDKKVYLVIRNNKEEAFLKEYPNFAKLYEKNGFIFFQKKDKYDK